MKILVAGNYDYYIYEPVVAETLKKQGHEVIEFHFRRYFFGLLAKLEEYFVFIGIMSFYSNYKLYKIVKKENPNVLLVWRLTLISKFFLKRIKKKTNVKLVSYNNDDPFSPKYKASKKIHQRRLWIYFNKSIPLFDINFVYRPQNIEDYKQYGSKKTLLFLPYYIPQQFSHIHQPNEKKYDVTFIGHYEKDRLEVINYLLENGVDVNIFGTQWKGQKISSKYKYGEIKPVYDDAYFQTIMESKVCLAFLSKLNRDIYTRRNFEIPACATSMVSQDTVKLREFFVADRDAYFFRNKEDALRVIKIALKNYEIVGENGQKRVEDIGGSVACRVDQLISDIKKIYISERFK